MHGFWPILPVYLALYSRSPDRNLSRRNMRSIIQQALFTGQLLSKTITGQVIENKKLCFAELESPINCDRDFS
ncbi:hypothetical protein QUA70_28040 [Microcoleus sp. LAD1_D5]